MLFILASSFQSERAKPCLVSPSLEHVDFTCSVSSPPCHPEGSGSDLRNLE